MKTACPAGDCTGSLPAPTPSQSWLYYPGDPGDFTPPAASSVTCSPTAAGYTGTAYERSIAGCVQAPIACNQSVHIDTSAYPTRDSQTARAVNCLTHATGDHADSVDKTTYPSPYYPFEFLAGDEDPLVAASVITGGQDVPVSDSIVAMPVFDSSGGVSSSVNIIGFVQLFLNPEGHHVHLGGGQQYWIHTMVINMVGCGTSASGTLNPVYGNGPSAVPVRLITPP